MTYSAAVNELQFQGGNYIVTWNYSSSSQEIEFEVRVTTTGFVGLGLSKINSGMRNLDIAIGGVNAGTNYLKDYYATGTGYPSEDSQQDTTLISASELNGVTMVRWKRRLNTGDAADKQLQPGDPVYIAWAYHASSDYPLRHTNVNRGYSSQIVLVPAVTTTSSSSVPEPTSVSPTTNPASIVYNKELSFKNGDYLVSWKFDSNTNELFFKLVVKATGWVGLGISNTNSHMKDLDVVIAGVSGGQGYIADYYSTSEQTPSRDTTEDYTLHAASENGQTTTVEFKRKINTGDDKDLQIVPGESYYLACAYHTSSDSLSYHSQRDYSPQKVVLAVAVTTTPTEGSSAATATYSVILIILTLTCTLIVYSTLQ